MWIYAEYITKEQDSIFSYNLENVFPKRFLNFAEGI